MTSIKERLATVHYEPEHIQDGGFCWCRPKSVSRNGRLEIDHIPNRTILAELFQKELLMLAEEVKPIELKHQECANGTAEACEDCLGRMNINVGLIRAAALIRSKADKLN